MTAALAVDGPRWLSSLPGIHGDLAKLTRPDGLMKGTMLARRGKGVLACVAWSYARPVGWMAAKRVDGRAEVHVFVHPKHRRKGLASAMLAVLLPAVRKRWKSWKPAVFPMDQAGNALYARHGLKRED